MKNLDLTLKNLKFHEDMSQETPCFSADLYEKGKLIAHVSNRGIGGCNDVYPAKGLTYKDVQHISDIDTDCYIIQLAEDLNFIKKYQGNNFVLKKEGRHYTVKTPLSFAKSKKASNYKEWLQKKMNKFEIDGYVVLNTNI